MSRAESASGSLVLDSIGGCTSNRNNDEDDIDLHLTSDYPASEDSSGCGALPAVSSLPGGSSEDLLEESCFSHEDVIEDIEDGTSSVLSSSTSLSTGGSSHECLAFRAPWATPPTATFEGNKLRNNPLQQFLTPLQARETLHCHCCNLKC